MCSFEGLRRVVHDITDSDSATTSHISRVSADINGQQSPLHPGHFGAFWSLREPLGCLPSLSETLKVTATHEVTWE